MANEQDLVIALNRILSYWIGWENNRKYYIEQLLPDMIAYREKNCTAEEKSAIAEIVNTATEEEIRNIVSIANNVENYRNGIQKTKMVLNEFIKKRDFIGAENYLLKYPSLRSQMIYSQLKNDLLLKIEKSINNFIKEMNAEGAIDLLNKEKILLSKEQKNKYENEIESIKQKNYEIGKRKNIINELECLWKNNEFKKADDFFLKQTIINYEDFYTQKTKHIQQFFRSQTINLELNEEQARVLSMLDKNLLVSARAGSGKTRVITAKIISLLRTYQVPISQILALAFNKSAANEIANRVKKITELPYCNARTFHSLAYNVIQPGKILFDQNHGEQFSEQKELSLYIQEIIKHEAKNPDFLNLLIQNFRQEIEEISNAGLFRSQEDYYLYRRSLKHITLNNQQVKSKGEKYIADFLFEHQVDYSYEKVWKWEGTYKPDFSMNIGEMNVVIEFWGIDENNPKTLDSKIFNTTYEQYLQSMKQKREYWEKEHPDVIFIELSVADLDRTKRERINFESILLNKFKEHNIFLQKLPQDQLLEKLKDCVITEMTKLLVQFIQRAKQNCWTVNDTYRKAILYSAPFEKEKAFLDLGCRVYKIYEKIKKIDGYIDFYDLLNFFIDKLENENLSNWVSLGYGHKEKVKICDIRWLLIDEFQDFTPLFFRIIECMMKYNEKLQIICVGDNWQAINEFAGSDLKYFNNFSSYFPNSYNAHLCINHRSLSKIVNLSNGLMKPDEPVGEVKPNLIGGEIEVHDISQVRKLDIPLSDNSISLDFHINQEGINQNSSKHYQAGQFLVLCFDILTRETNRGISTIILSRKNDIRGVGINNFLDRLKNLLVQWRNIKKIRVNWDDLNISTVHRFKGGEKEIVIILDVCLGSFPLIHSYSTLFNFFGKTIQDTLDEEKRLFYVALTRAKKRLYLLTEKGKESEYLDMLPRELIKYPNAGKGY